MTDMQRYSVDDDGFQTADERGPFVLYSDAEAAIAAARAEAVAEHIALVNKVQAEQYSAGQRDMLAKCIAAVEALRPLLSVDKYIGGYDCCGCSTLDELHDDSIAALRALREVDTPQQQLNEHINLDTQNRIGDDTTLQSAGCESNISPDGYDPRAADNRP